MKPTAKTVVSLLLPALALLSASAAERPNILLIMVDDLGYHDLGCQGAADIRTPRIDALASAGIRFTDGYVTSPQCGPSRAALLTGMSPRRFGYINNDTRNGLPAKTYLTDYFSSRAAGFVETNKERAWCHKSAVRIGSLKETRNGNPVEAADGAKVPAHVFSDLRENPGELAEKALQDPEEQQLLAKELDAWLAKTGRDAETFTPQAPAHWKPGKKLMPLDGN
jgi:hypothetical protein